MYDEPTGSRLAAAIEMLTREHKTIAHTEDGIEVHDRPALLDQLREAVFGGMESTGGSSMGAKLPISEAALDLYELIDHQIAEAWAQTHGRPPGADRPERLAAEWSAAVRADTLIVVTTPEQYERWDETKNRMATYVIHARSEHTPDALAEKWVEMIETFFDPPRQAEIQAACFVCDTRKVQRRKDGELVDSSALVFNRDRQTGETRYAECLACGTRWAPSQFKYLAEQIAASGGKAES